MKIIHRGIPRADRKFRGTCHGCWSVVEATRGELKVESDYRSVGTDTPTGEFAHAACPVCGTSFVLYPYTPPAGPRND